ncbi:MAG: neuraminidase-like domain-containing protein [Pyrinomonadaceae bacterium]
MAIKSNENYIVTGLVTDQDGLPLTLEGLTIQAFDRDLRHEQPLGKTQPDKLGFYKIPYTASQFRQAEKNSADLIVKAFASDGSLLAESPTMFNAPPEAEVNLTVVDDTPLFEKIAREIRPLLENLKVEKLEEDKEHQDLSFLAGETRFEKHVLARFVLAHKLAAQAIEPEFWFAVLSGSFYEYSEDQSLADQLSTIVDRLVSLDAGAVGRSLSRSFNQNEISRRFEDNAERWVAAFLKFIAARTVSGAGEPTFVKSALDDAGIKDAKKQEKFARLFNEHRSLTPELLESLEKDKSFKKTEIADLRTSFELGNLTQGDFSVVKTIKDGFSVRSPEQIRTLAKKSETEWVNLVRTKHAKGQIKLPFEPNQQTVGKAKLPEAEIYGKTLERQFREAFPTTAFAGGLERALDNGGSQGLRHAETFGRFLERHDNFELLNTPVDDFLKNNVHRDFREAAADDSFKLEVKAVQRVFKLAPTFEATDALLADDLHSAQQVYRMGESEFVRSYADKPGFTTETARLTWNRAADTHAAVLTVVADLKALEAEGLPMALKFDSAALAKFPNWNNLFQTGDLCDCKHCNSVLGPAAYYADLLMFLKDRKAKNTAFTVKDVLFDRRPDLGFLELNCENALTPLPYVDVVCEVLEDAVDTTGENDLELVGLTVIPAAPAAAKTAVATAFENAFVDPINDGKEKIDLGADFSLSQINPPPGPPPPNPNLWVVHGDNVTYLLKKKATPNFFAEILRNTKTSTDELRAFPQYVNPKAYAKLRAAKYPMTLPFDLFAEEVRAAFQKTNLQRWDLMRTLRGGAPPNDPTDGDIAAEYFGISSEPSAAFDEKRLILQADATVVGQRTVWGETGANWLNKVGNVKNVLEKTSLEYNDLLALLDLKFINPTGDIAVQHLDASCDTNQKVIQILDATRLDRIHRFLRLWRKLKGWKMWELDLVIRHPQIGNGTLDETFLINLFYFGQLRKRLGKKATAEQTCALFGNLNTETRFTELHEKRANAVYQNLFLNKRLISPIDPAFLLDPVTGDLVAGEIITDHHSPVLATLGIRETDLILLKELTRASDGAPYINDDLTLTNLSFLWRHAWLAKLLKIKVTDWKILLKIFGQDVLDFADPKTAFEFVEAIDHLKNTGFNYDELNWLLTADRTAKAAVKETDAARFLTALRKELQTIEADHDPVQYDFLSAVPPTDADSLSVLLSTLLQKLNRTEAEVSSFLKTLRGPIELESAVQDLPVGFMFPAAVTGAPNHIPVQYNEPDKMIRFIGVMTDIQRTTLLAVTPEAGYQNAIEDLFQQSQAAPLDYVSATASSAIVVTAPNDKPSIPVSYDAITQMVSFFGLMTTADQIALKAANPAASAAIDELFLLPRTGVKFYENIFTVTLETLPAAIDFKAQLEADLAARISYDAEQSLLRFAGIVTTAQQAALNALAPNVLPEEVAYHNAVNDLAAQPQTIVSPDDRVWLTDADLDATLPANDTYAKRLANAANRALVYLDNTLSENAVIAQSSAQLGLTEALTRRLLADYTILPAALLDHLVNIFAATSGVVDYLTLKATFDGWFWANRVASIWKKWKIALPDLDQIIALTTGAQLLNFQSLPLDDTGAITPIDRFLRTNRLLRVRDSLPETLITLFEVLEKLDAGAYATAADFAADVELLNENWLTADVEGLVAALDLAYPADYLLAESWERLRRAFYFLENLNAAADTAITFAAAAMSLTHANAIKELLLSKFGDETWFVLSGEIQDVLRERKRDALAAYLLLTQPKNPADVPSGKWENTNDIYAYYLLDVEMSSCQLTSRLVQGSGSVQLFVQRCFMGLEPDVVVNADGATGDSAWRWWKWMRKYRVWEANRKVFLWPENWIEPELKIDRSTFFKDLENELLQNEVDQYTVETAFQNYLEKLDGVAQLEIAGFYQEDDGDLAIIHVFGRTKGAEPHLYYYRTYDYRQWSPWEKVDLDIQGDYLIPAVVNKRLFLFWPVFTEVPDENANSTVSIPKMELNKSGQTTQADKTKKRLRMQMAVSDYRQGKWSPKKISKDFKESGQYEIEIVKKHYKFFPVDRSEIDGRFGIKFSGNSVGSNGTSTAASLTGAFEIANCNGVPELTNDLPGNFIHIIRPEQDSTGLPTVFLKWNELSSRTDSPPENDLTLVSDFSNQSSGLTRLLTETPWRFKISPPWHLSYMDKLFLDGISLFGGSHSALLERGIPFGSWLPFFYNDKKRTFFVLPVIKTIRRDDRGNIAAGPSNSSGVAYYYPDIKKFVREFEDYFAGQIQTWLDSIDFSAIPAGTKLQIGQFLGQAFPEEFPPPYTDDQLKNLLKRWFMRFVHYLLGSLSLLAFQFRRFHFKNYYHPFVCDFAKLLYNPLKGIPALMSRETQLKDSGFSFRQNYVPQPAVIETSTEEFYPKEMVDFTPDGAYSPYNWELFFHAPLLIANSLSKNQRFEEARDWYHFIFNPIGVESGVSGGSIMSKYWITKPFFETTDPQYVQQRIENIMRMLAGDTSIPGFSAQAKKDLEDQVYDWRTNPFEPHRIANYRTVAYQKTVVMKYLDNLIAWGDYLFRQDSMESINEATQLYILAAEILGERPRKIPPQVKPPVESFNELEHEFDTFSNALIEVENLVPPLSGEESSGSNSAPLPILYFCIPQNDKLLGYWDTVADRLYKIRHCMNIEGVVRQLALFEPPIDPGALVKAIAGGMDLSSALADLNAPLPLYRFNVLLQKANEVCNDVKALGNALLSALEKKDAEALSLLRQKQEITLLEAVKTVREMQIEEAKGNLAGIKKSKELAEIKKKYYDNREFLNDGETAAMVLSGISLGVHTAGTIMDILGGVLAAIPDFDLGVSGFGGSPTVKVKTGGVSFSKVAELAARGLYQTSTILDKSASIATTMASFQRRMEEWNFQKDLAIKEIEQIDESIATAELRIEIAQKELENHVIQIENSKATDEFMRSKYTNQELYQWQMGQISGVYFQSYKLAYDLAKRAERCFRFELGLQDSSYINFGYWDSLKKGLLSGEKLQYDLRRLESAHLEQNRREFELTKHISLAMLDPLALLKLRETGRCFLRFPEEIFDLDYPGHYFRRIKSMSLTLPCVVGPYTTISCTLRLLKNSIRVKTTNGDNGYERNADDNGLPADDERFVENNIPVKAIAASSGQNDSGVFELSFRDERYLPFEGAGAVSEWSLELFSDLPANNPDPANPDYGKALRQFDYNSISDAILHINYTAREDAGPFKNGAVTHLRDYFEQDGETPLVRMFNLRQEFPTEWHRFLNPVDPADGNVLDLEMNQDLFPFRDKEKTLTINRVWLLARCKNTGIYDVVMTPPLPELPAGSNNFALAPSNQFGGLHFNAKENVGVEIDLTDPPVTWQLKMTGPVAGNLQADPVEVEDMLLVLGYQWSV